MINGALTPDGIFWMPSFKKSTPLSINFDEKFRNNYSYDLGFRNIGEKVANNVKVTTGNTTTYTPQIQQFIGVDQVTKNVKIKLAEYQLRIHTHSVCSIL